MLLCSSRSSSSSTSQGTCQGQHALSPAAQVISSGAQSLPQLTRMPPPTVLFYKGLGLEKPGRCSMPLGEGGVAMWFEF